MTTWYGTELSNAKLKQVQVVKYITAVGTWWDSRKVLIKEKEIISKFLHKFYFLS